MKKINVLVVLIVVLLCTSVTCFAADEEYTTADAYADGYEEGYAAGKSKSEERTPYVIFKNPEEIPEVNPGETLELTIKFKNDSKYPAQDLKIVPQIEEDGGIIIYEKPQAYESLSMKANKEASYVFKFKISDDAKKGTYKVKFKLDYRNTYKETFTREETAYFKVISEKTRPVLNISNIKRSVDKLKAGDAFSLSFDINNTGGSEAKDVEVKLDGFDNNTIMPIDSKDYSYVGTIERKDYGPQSQVTLKYDLIISSDIETTNNTLTVTVTYKTYDDKEQTLTKKIYITGVEIPKKESGDKKEEEKKEEKKYAKPKMIISSYSLSPNSITAGDIFTFSFNFKNTSKEKSIRNVKATVSSKEGAFIITRGSNTFYIESIGKNSVVGKSIELKAKQDLTSNSYEVYINFDYEDYDGNEYSSQETINIPVTEYSKLVINSAMVGDSYVNENTGLSFDYVNMGKATVSNLTATVEGDFEPVQESNYIGNIQAGNSDYYDIEVKPTKEGKNYGTLVLKFEDSSGKEIEVRREFEGEAMNAGAFENTDMPEGMDNGMDLEPVEEGIHFETWQIVLAGIGAFLVTFIIIRMITKKIIMKKIEEDL